MSSKRRAGESQYQEFIDEIRRRGPERMGLMTSWAWLDDPKRLAFMLSRLSRGMLMKAALASWDALGHVQRLDGTTLFHLVNVLVHSLPDEAVGRGAAPLAFEPEPPVIRPTAANPRAYKGTKDRPPKVKKPGAMDLRPHLSSARDVNDLLAKLAPFHSEASRLLKKGDILVRLKPPKGRRRGGPSRRRRAC